MKILDFFSFGMHLFFLLFKFSTMFKESLIFFFMLKSFFSESNFLCFNLFFQLVYLMINNFISSFCFCNFILCFRQLFNILVPICSDGFIEFLLLLKFILCFYIFLLIFRYQVTFQFNLLKRLQIFSVGQCSFLPICIFLFFNGLNLLLY